MRKFIKIFPHELSACINSLASEQSRDIGFRSLTLAVTGTLVVTLTSTITRKFFLPQICL